MSVGKNIEGVQAFGMMGPYKPSVSSTERLRQFLLSRNLQSSYLADGNPIPPAWGIQPPGDQKLNQFYEISVKDQPTVEETGAKSQRSLFLDNGILLSNNSISLAVER